MIHQLARDSGGTKEVSAGATSNGASVTPPSLFVETTEVKREERVGTAILAGHGPRGKRSTRSPLASRKIQRGEGTLAFLL